MPLDLLDTFRYLLDTFKHTQLTKHQLSKLKLDNSHQQEYNTPLTKTIHSINLTKTT